MVLRLSALRTRRTLLPRNMIILFYVSGTHILVLSEILFRTLLRAQFDIVQSQNLYAHLTKGTTCDDTVIIRFACLFK
jgi:hypothetical protein